MPLISAVCKFSPKPTKWDGANWQQQATKCEYMSYYYNIYMLLIGISTAAMTDKIIHEPIDARGHRAQTLSMKEGVAPTWHPTCWFPLG